MTGLAKIVFVALVVVLVSISFVGQLFSGPPARPFYLLLKCHRRWLSPARRDAYACPLGFDYGADGIWRRIAPAVFSHGAV